MKYTIAKAQEEELEEATRLLWRVLKKSYAPFLTKKDLLFLIDKRHTPHHLRQLIRDKNSAILIAKNNSHKIIGVLTLTKIEADTVIISRFAIQKRYQRKGIGKALLNKGIALFPGVEKAVLYVFEQNDIGRSFYQKNGFSPIQSGYEEFPSGQIKRLLLEKILEPK